MLRTLRSLVIICFVLATVLLAACGGNGNNSGNATAAGMTPSGSQPTASPQDQAAEARQQFEAERARIEAEQQHQEERAQHRRSFIAVEFHEIDAEGRVIVMLTNQTDRDIDDIRGGFQAVDSDGNYLAATGFTEAVPGSVFLAAGAQIEHAPYGFGSKAELIEQLNSDPSNVHISFEAHGLTWADGSTEPDLDG